MPAGRPTLLTSELIEDFRRLLPTALYLETVGDYLGVERTTWRKWLKRGRKEADRLRNSDVDPDPQESLFLEFFHTHKKSLADGELKDLGTILKASEDQYEIVETQAATETEPAKTEKKLLRRGEWQAAAWRQERRQPKRWGKKDAVEVTGKNKGPIEVVEVVVTTREQAAEVLARLPGANGVSRQ
jgi:hypothetical protein